MYNVIRGPAALSYRGCNGHRYWFGVASGNIRCDKLRCTPERAIRDAEKKENGNPKPQEKK